MGGSFWDTLYYTQIHIQKRFTSGVLMARLALDRFFKAKHKRCIVRGLESVA